MTRPYAGDMPVALVHGRSPGREPTYIQELLELLRIMVVAGITVGILVIGLGSRLAMFLLRVTSPHSVIGVRSDDDFVIGQITLSGTYNLVTIGAAAGFIGAVAYVAVAPWLIGPGWFRRLTVGLTAGALVGSMIIKPDGIDFRELEPTWFAVGLFVGLPVLVGIALSIAVDAVAAPGSWTALGRRRWLLPLVLLALVPLSLGLVVPLALIVAVLLVLRRYLLAPLRSSRFGTFVVRAAFFVIPVLSVIGLSGDLADLY